MIFSRTSGCSLKSYSVTDSGLWVVTFNGNRIFNNGYYSKQSTKHNEYVSITLPRSASDHNMSACDKELFQLFPCSIVTQESDSRGHFVPILNVEYLRYTILCLLTRAFHTITFNAVIGEWSYILECSARWRAHLAKRLPLLWTEWRSNVKLQPSRKRLDHSFVCGRSGDKWEKGSKDPLNTIQWTSG